MDALLGQVLQIFPPRQPTGTLLGPEFFILQGAKNVLFGLKTVYLLIINPFTEVPSRPFLRLVAIHLYSSKTVFFKTTLQRLRVVPSTTAQQAEALYF
jgi:hypothetical protein